MTPRPTHASGPELPSGEADCYSRAGSREISPAAPDWFHDAMAVPYDVGSVLVGGTTINCLSWGPHSGPATVLVHGGAAHAMWWAPLAAQLDPRRRVVAMDLSGHGTSGYRPAYSAALWGQEIAAVAGATSDGAPTVVGHSLGGIVLAHVAHAHLEQLEHVVLVDSPVWDRAPAPERELARVSGHRPRDYPDLATAMSRFRLVPPQACENQWYVDHIARHGLAQGEDGWHWRFDPEVFAGPTGARSIVRFEGDLSEVGCRWSIVVGERSYLADGARTTFTSRPEASLRFVPDAAHHVMLDQPLALLATLRAVLST